MMDGAELGTASSTSVMFTVIAWVTESVPSLTVTVAVYEFLVS